MTRILALPILLVLPLAAVAQPDEINYLYLGLGYGQSELDVAVGPDLEASGISLEGSVPLREHIHVFGGYGASEFDNIADADSVEKYFGIGTQWNFGQKFSVFGRLGFLDADLDIGTGNFEDDGLLLGAGVRFMPVPGWEVRGGVEYVDLELAGSDTIATIASDLFVTDVVALTIELNANDDATSVTIGGRFYFGNETLGYSRGR